MDSQLVKNMIVNGKEKQIKSLTIWMSKTELDLHILPRFETHGDPREKIFRILDVSFEKYIAQAP